MYLIALFLPILSRPGKLLRLDCVTSSDEQGRLYLSVPFHDKEEVKQYGARWDANSKQWFVLETQDSEKFQRWKKIYLDVPFGEKDQIKSLGGIWDKESMKWCIPGYLFDDQFLKWLPQNSIVPAVPKKSVTVSDPSPTVETTIRTNFIETNILDEEVIFLSIATNGLPKRSAAKLTYADLEQFDSCRVVGISCVICKKETLTPSQSLNILIKSDGFPIDNTEFHGITLKASLGYGLDFKDAIEKELFPIFKRSKSVVAHSADFSLNALKSELFRYGMTDILSHIENVMTPLSVMELTADLVNIPGTHVSKKPPSLAELYLFATGNTIDTKRQHIGRYDLECLLDSVKSLVQKGAWKL